MKQITGEDLHIPKQFKNATDYAEWLADKIHAHGDYAKESAAFMQRIAKLYDSPPDAKGELSKAELKRLYVQASGDLSDLVDAKGEAVAGDVKPDVYDIAVDTGDGIFWTAEVVNFQQNDNVRKIQVRILNTTTPNHTEALRIAKEALQKWELVGFGNSTTFALQMEARTSTQQALAEIERIGG